MKIKTLLLLFALFVSFSASAQTYLNAGYQVRYVDEYDGETRNKKEIRSALATISQSFVFDRMGNELEGFAQYRANEDQGFRAGLILNANLLPFYQSERSSLRTLFGLGLIFDTHNNPVDYLLQIKLNWKYQRIKVEIGGNIEALEAYYFDSAPVAFVNVGIALFK